MVAKLAKSVAGNDCRAVRAKAYTSWTVDDLFPAVLCCFIPSANPRLNDLSAFCIDSNRSRLDMECVDVAAHFIPELGRVDLRQPGEGGPTDVGAVCISADYTVEVQFTSQG